MVRSVGAGSLSENWVARLVAGKFRPFSSANAFPFQVRHLAAFSIGNGVLPGWTGIGARMAPTFSQQHGNCGTGLRLAMGVVDADDQSLAWQQHRAAVPANAHCCACKGAGHGGTRRSGVPATARRICK